VRARGESCLAPGADGAPRRGTHGWEPAGKGGRGRGPSWLCPRRGVALGGGHGGERDLREGTVPGRGHGARVLGGTGAIRGVAKEQGVAVTPRGG